MSRLSVAALSAPSPAAGQRRRGRRRHRSSFVGIRWANTGDKLAEGTRRGSRCDGAARRRGPCSSHRPRRPGARARGRTFIHTAVCRRHLDEAWALAAPELRERDHAASDWRTGNIPVVPFPASDIDQIRWTPRLLVPAPDVGMKIALDRRSRTRSTTAMVASMELQAVGRERAPALARRLLGAARRRRRPRRAIEPLGSRPDASPQTSGAELDLAAAPDRADPRTILLLPVGLGVRGWRAAGPRASAPTARARARRRPARARPRAAARAGGA